MLHFVLFAYTGIKSFSFLCWMLRIVEQKVSTKSLMAAFSDGFPSSPCLLLREYWNLVPSNISVRVKETKIWLPFKTLGAHFLSQDVQRTTQETETLDACIERMISLSSSWKMHVERCELKITDVFLSVKLHCSCILFTGEAILCHGPGWGGRVLSEFLGGDMPLRSRNLLVIPEQVQLNFATL